MKVNEAKKKCFLPSLRPHGSQNSRKFAEFADPIRPRAIFRRARARAGAYVKRMNFVPPELDRILRQTPELQHAWLVGGCVRDALLGSPGKDFDVEVFGIGYEKLAQALSRWGKVDLVGQSFGVAKLTTGGEHSYDFTIPRKDSKMDPRPQGLRGGTGPGPDSRGGGGAARFHHQFPHVRSAHRGDAGFFWRRGGFGGANPAPHQPGFCGGPAARAARNAVGRAFQPATGRRNGPTVPPDSRRLHRAGRPARAR